MDNSEQRDEAMLLSKYSVIIDIIYRIENRLGIFELVHLVLNPLILAFVISILVYMGSIGNYPPSTEEASFVLFSLVLGMAINANWVAIAMRAQLKLKLKYFQARQLERRMNIPGEYFFSDESILFNPATRLLQSPDKVETLEFPSSGFARMDGFIGSAKPRYLSWVMPSLFFIIYISIFIRLLIGILKA